MARTLDSCGEVVRCLDSSQLVASGTYSQLAASDMVPGLGGEFVNIRESSAKMSVGRMASLIEFCQAYCVDNNIRLSA